MPARFLVMSDLHDEQWRSLSAFAPLPDPVDAVLVAGDLSTKMRHLDVMRRLWEVHRAPVRMVRGNHEFYHSDVKALISAETGAIAELRAAGVDIGVMDRHVEIIGGVRVLGATLWTDFALDPDRIGLACDIAWRSMNDFNYIHMDKRVMTPDDQIEMHARDRAFLLEALDAPFDGPTLVMTHHLPVREMVHPRRWRASTAEVTLNAAFASDLWPELRRRRIDAWLCGHSHDNCTVTLEGEHGPVAFISNARGYPGEGARFDPGRVIEIPVDPRPAP